LRLTHGHKQFVFLDARIEQTGDVQKNGENANSCSESELMNLTNMTHPSTRRIFILAACLFALARTASAQTTYVWQGVNGSWNTTGNWVPGGPPDGVDNTIGSINPGGTRTITLDGNHTIGNISFTVNNNRTYIINSGTPSTSVLTLQVSSGTPGVSVAAGATAGFLIVNAPIDGTQGLTKTGIGSFVLGGANTYTGTTTVSAGNFVVNGSLAAGSPVVVNGGQLGLGGSGTINGGITLNSGGKINPGSIILSGTAPAAQVGNLTGGSLLWNGGGELDLQLGDPSAAANSDEFNLIGSLTKGSAGTFNFSFTQLAGFSTSGTYTLMNFASQSGFSASDFGGAPSGMQFDLTPTSLLLDPVPEPSTAALFGLGATALFFFRHRKV
jgi:autotransporter-associated beta strand protein